MFDKQRFWIAAAVCATILLLIQILEFKTCEMANENLMTRVILPYSPLNSSKMCTCFGYIRLKLRLSERLQEDKLDELSRSRAKEMRKHKARTTTVLTRPLFAAPNCPLQYPIQGFIVRPLTTTLIPGLMLHVRPQGSYTVSLSVSKGVLTSGIKPEGVTIQGDGERNLVLESSSLVTLNDVLAKVSYTSTVYHIHTGDLATFRFEDHQAVFPITIKQPHVPVLYDMGPDMTDISSYVTITTKTFLRYPNLKVLISSIRSFYSDIKIVIADDSLEPEKVTGEHIEHYIMPPAQGWFAGRNLAISQVTTKYLLWVDDDYLFTEETKIENMVKVMEAYPELDVIGGSVAGNRFYFTIEYEEGDEMEGGCLYRKSKGTLTPLPGFPQCTLVHGVVNFFLARTYSVQKVGFDPKLQRVAHSEFFMDGLGFLMVATCENVTIAHQPRDSKNKDASTYNKFRSPPRSDQEFKYQHHFFKNNLKCIRYG